MEIPNESDLSLLSIIATLSQQDGGRPPTFAEIAVTAGLQSSSRGNVQRQLSRLRPIYVDWDSSPRSLVLTDAAYALLTRQKEVSPSAFDVPLPDAIPSLLASGLTRMVKLVAENRPLQAPYPAAWQRGLNMLAVECMMRGIEPPTHTQAAVALCKKTLNLWPVRFALPTHLLDEPLLDREDSPTTFCRELAENAVGGDAEHELCQDLMRKIRRTAELLRKQSAYVALRRHLIEHAVMPLHDLIDAASSAELGVFGSDLHDLYETVPFSAFEGNHVLLCGHCGWTLTRKEGRLHCGGAFCEVLTDDFTRGTSTLSLPERGGLVRVRSAIRDYVVAPGKSELALFEALESMGVPVELWPYFDRYDLRISLSHDDIWAVDVKDWTYPHLLARRLTPLSNEEEYNYTQAFYAIPDARIRHTPSYLEFLRAATVGQPFSVVSVNALIARVQERKRQLDARY